MKHALQRAGSACLIILWCASCAINPVTRKTEIVFMSEAEEIELGRSYHEQFLNQDRTYEDSHLQRYLNGLGQNLASLSHRSQLDYHFNVVDSPEVNAFALPGGYIYVARGMLAYLNSEAELAAVVGHEIGHVAARHAVRKDVRLKAQEFLGKSLFNRIGFGLDRGYNGYAQARRLDYSQAFELQADELALEYLTRAGYSPSALSNVISTIQGNEQRIRDAHNGQPGSRLYHGFNTHPDSGLRKALVEQDVRRIQDDLPDSRSNREDYLKRLDGLVFGPSEHGRIIDGRFIHASSRIAFDIPAGWHIDSHGKILKLVAADESAVIQVLSKPHFTGDTARRHLIQLLISDELFDEHPLPNKDIDGWMASSTKQTRDGEIPVWIATCVADDVVWIMVATAQDEQRFASTIVNSMRSFRRPAPADLKRAQPRRIRVIEAQAGITYSALAANSPLGDDAELQLRLINGQIAPHEQPIPGSLIKIVE
jgi:predicted Zn-dependent protease